MLSNFVNGIFIAGNLASAYYDQGQLDLAIMHYKQALTCDSGFVEAYNNLVSVLCSVSCYWVSIFNPLGFNSSGKLFPWCNVSWFPIIQKGNALKDAGRVEEAINCYRVISSPLHLLYLNSIFLSRISDLPFFLFN